MLCILRQQCFRATVLEKNGQNRAGHRAVIGQTVVEPHQSLRCLGEISPAVLVKSICFFKKTD